VSRTRLRVAWHRCGLSWQEQVERILAYATGIRTLHPLLSDFSWKGNEGGYTNMLLNPNIWDMTEEQRYGMFDFEEDSDFFLFEFWNRRSKDSEDLIHWLSFNKIVDCIQTESYMATDDIPTPLVTDDLLIRWLEIAITTFDADVAEIATIERKTAPNDDEVYLPLWRIWLKVGSSPHQAYYLLPSQAQPYTDEQPWLGGTLYTWPEFAPWDLLNERSILTRDLPA
jgi:hypothetical protein